MTHAEPRKFVFRVALAALFVASAGGLVQASVVETFGANNARVEAKVTAGFDGPGSGAADFASIVAPPVTTNPLAGFHFPTTAFTSTPPASSSAPKDKAEVGCTAIFDYGAPVGPGANDQIAFEVAGTVSALDAKNLAGNPADAVALAHGSVMFFLDASYGGVAPGTVVGYLSFPALRNLLPNEELLTVHVTQESLLAISPDVLTINAGDPNATAPLYAEAQYLITLDYKAKAPFGTDPPFSVGYTVGVNTPEPATLSLLALGGLAVLRRRGRK
jgi:hypothetical protein